MLTMSDFERESKKTNIFFVLVIGWRSIKHLCFFFRLPPLHDIQQAIDPVSSTSWPTSPAYQMNTKKHAELRRQVWVTWKGIYLGKLESFWSSLPTPKDRLYEGLVIIFRLTNSSSIFMQVMTQILIANTTLIIDIRAKGKLMFDFQSPRLFWIVNKKSVKSNSIWLHII